MTIGLLPLLVNLTTREYGMTKGFFYTSAMEEAFSKKK